MQAHKLRITVMGLGTNGRLDDDRQPLLKVGTECLPAVTEWHALLHVTKRLRKLGGDGFAGPTVEGFSPTAAILPPEIHAGLPSAIGQLNDAAFPLPRLRVLTSVS